MMEWEKMFKEWEKMFKEKFGKILSSEKNILKPDFYCDILNPRSNRPQSG